MTSDYLSFFFNIPRLSYLDVLTLFFLTLMRMAPIAALAPFLGAKVAPTIVRACLAISLSVIFLPTMMTSLSHTIAFDQTFLWLSFKEILIGMVLGFLICIPFYVASNAGVIIDFLRGSSMMQVQDPTMQEQASPIGILYNYMLIVLFFQIDGPFYFFDAILKSYTLIPVDGFFNAKFFAPSIPFWMNSMNLINYIVSISIQLAAPSIIGILMAEMFLGIANRLAPQVQIAFLGMSIKSVLGIFLLWAAWFFTLKQLSHSTLDWIKTINSLLDSVKYLQG